MKKTYSITLLIVTALFLMSGCYGWKRITAPDLTGPLNAYTLKLPVDWIQLTGNGIGVFITKDGPSLQYIHVEKLPHAAAFKQTKVIINKDILVTELAEYYIANFKAARQGVPINLLETKPALIDNHPGFRIHLELTNPKGLKFDTIAYGFTDETHFYQFVYQAPRIHYFEKDLETFESVVRSFKINPNAKAAPSRKDINSRHRI